MIIQLPPEQITPDLQPRLADAVRKFSEARQVKNDAMVKISRRRSLIGLVIAILIASLLLALLVILSNTILVSSSEPVKVILGGIVTIFIWSTIWNPWYRLVYDWIEPWRENQILRKITTMDIIVQPEPTLAN